ncbi:hypothetical protein C8R43DRAFT_974971 [Mycena crocata]|nr:hypothetical protein C8R43DRAFT_974971 [Mycena crocata]
MKEDIASRKYIDLIHAKSSKWANWDPSHPIEVGDYGQIDKKTGIFGKEGNIYKTPETAEIAAIAAAHPPELGAPEEDMIILSETTTERQFSLGPQVSVPGIAEASLKGQWKFGTGRTGALLVMAAPQSKFVSYPNALLKQLLAVPTMKDKDTCVVTQVSECRAYSMYLSSKSEDTLSLALLSTTPLPVAPLVSAGGEVGVTWWSQTGGGVFRQGAIPPRTPDTIQPSTSESDTIPPTTSDTIPATTPNTPPTAHKAFTPLFTLRRLKKRAWVPFRGGPEEEEVENELWEGVETPWKALDEDGEEEEEDDFYDAVHDD